MLDQCLCARISNFRNRKKTCIVTALPSLCLPVYYIIIISDTRPWLVVVNFRRKRKEKCLKSFQLDKEKQQKMQKNCNKTREREQKRVYKKRQLYERLGKVRKRTVYDARREKVGERKQQKRDNTTKTTAKIGVFVYVCVTKLTMSLYQGLYTHRTSINSYWKSTPNAFFSSSYSLALEQSEYKIYYINNWIRLQTRDTFNKILLAPQSKMAMDGAVHGKKTKWKATKHLQNVSPGERAYFFYFFSSVAYFFSHFHPANNSVFLFHFTWAHAKHSLTHTRQRYRKKTHQHIASFMLATVLCIPTISTATYLYRRAWRKHNRRAA